TVLFSGSIGILSGCVQCVPSTLVLINTSSDEQPVRKRQSDHTTYTFPEPSISADGQSGLRSPPSSPSLLPLAIVTLFPHVLPSTVETNDATPKNPEYGSTTVPSGRTSGCPPSPPA